MNGKEKLIAEMEKVREEIRETSKRPGWAPRDPIMTEASRRLRSIPMIVRTKENSERYKNLRPGESWTPWKVWKTEQLIEEIRNEHAQNK